MHYHRPDVTKATQVHSNQPQTSFVILQEYFTWRQRVSVCCNVALAAVPQRFRASQARAEPILAAAPKIKDDTDTLNEAKPTHIY